MTGTFPPIDPHKTETVLEAVGLQRRHFFVAFLLGTMAGYPMDFHLSKLEARQLIGSRIDGFRFSSSSCCGDSVATFRSKAIGFRADRVGRKLNLPFGFG